MFLQTDLKVCAEVFVLIRHNLVSHAGDIGRVKRIYSSPQPTAQCRGWLRATAAEAPVNEVSTTAKAAIAQLRRA
jgi:chorismate mutase/prephenate dehydratase